MITLRLYNKKTNKLTTWFKSEFHKTFTKNLIWAFAKDLEERTRCHYNNYIAYAKNGKIIAREARYQGV